MKPKKQATMSLKLSIVLSELWALVWLSEMCWKVHQTFFSSTFFNFWSLIWKKRVPQICVESWLQWFSSRRSQNILKNIMKYIEVRQKVLLALCKSDIKHDKGLVLMLFYRTLERGLLSLYVVQGIKPLLRSIVCQMKTWLQH